MSNECVMRSDGGALVVPGTATNDSAVRQRDIIVAEKGIVSLRASIRIVKRVSSGLLLPHR
jgi:hypothetical protein